MSLSVETLAVAKKYTDDSIAGAGAIEGKPCQIQSITDITGGHRVTFLWVDNDGVSHTSTMDVMDGVTPDLTLYQTKALETALTIGGVSQTSVEGALGGLNGLVPSDASSNNKLVAKDELSANATDAENFYTSTATFNNRAAQIVYYKICKYLSYYPFIVRCEAQRTNTTAAIQEVSGSYYTDTRKYTLTKFAIPRYAASSSVVATTEYGGYLIVDANDDVWLSIASYSKAKITITASSKITIDGTSGTPVTPYKLNGYSDADNKVTSTVTSGSNAPITSGGVDLAITPQFQQSVNVDNYRVGTASARQSIGSGAVRTIYMGTRGNGIIVRTSAFSETRFTYPVESGSIVRTLVSGTEPFTYAVAGSQLTLTFTSATEAIIERIL